MERAAEMSPEAFSREAGRWAVKRQDDGGEGEYRRQRARRRLSFWNGDDGMVHLRGELDPVTGAKVHKPSGCGGPICTVPAGRNAASASERLTRSTP